MYAILHADLKFWILDRMTSLQDQYELGRWCDAIYFGCFPVCASNMCLCVHTPPCRYPRHVSNHGC